MLKLAGEPMTVPQIHRAAEEVLGRQLSYASLKETLSEHTRKRNGRFERVRRGCYGLQS